MQPHLRRLQQRLRNAPPQLILMAVVAVAAGASALYSAVGRQPGPRIADLAGRTVSTRAQGREEQQPVASRAVEDAFEAARRGDIEDYLSQFSDPLLTQLNRVRVDRGDDDLRDYLRRTTASVKGIAVDLTRQEDMGPSLIRLPVRIIYEDRDEAQPFWLRHEGGRWHIIRIDPVRSVPTLIPFGTPVWQAK